MKRFLFETVILVVLCVTGFFLYQTYGDDVRRAFFSSEPFYTIYVDSVAVEVTVADDQGERIRGLSGVPSLDDFEGKLFVFDDNAKHGIWMKDMLMPIDILWIDEELEVVHIEENVSPSTYPSQVFAPPTDARFVLEMNAFFVDAVKIEVGDQLTLPPSLLPDDVRENLSL